MVGGSVLQGTGGRKWDISVEGFAEKVILKCQAQKLGPYPRDPGELWEEKGVGAERPLEGWHVPYFPENKI